jgi:hypothetical protein
MWPIRSFLRTLIPLIIVLSTPVRIWAGDARTLRLDDKRVGKVYVSFGKSTVLSFPGKPTKVVLGSKGAFTLEYIDNDLAIAALTLTAQSNLFVYVQGRRFAFDLISRSKNADEIVLVRDLDLQSAVISK